MIEIRFHGRGGQGAVTASRIITITAYEEGKYSQGGARVRMGHLRRLRGRLDS